jgi:hypothetical protein
MRLQRVRYTAQSSKLLFLEMLRDDVSVTPEDNDRIRA